MKLELGLEGLGRHASLRPEPGQSRTRRILFYSVNVPQTAVRLETENDWMVRTKKCGISYRHDRILKNVSPYALQQTVHSCEMSQIFTVSPISLSPILTFDARSILVAPLVLDNSLLWTKLWNTWPFHGWSQVRRRAHPCHPSSRVPRSDTQTKEPDWIKDQGPLLSTFHHYNLPYHCCSRLFAPSLDK